MSGPSPWWDGARHGDRRPFLALRSRLLADMRAWFLDQGFLEADVGALVRAPGAETHLQAFEAGGAYLHTSPEFAMKKLLAAGERDIFFLGKVYRAGDIGPLHAPEFTMLEWYRAGAPYERVMDDCVALARLACRTTGASAMTWRGVRCDVQAPPARVRVADILPRSLSHDDFSTRITEAERALGHPQLSILYEYPLAEAALARVCADDPMCAERFELYACGVELANGFGELTDPVEQRARLEAAMAEKKRLYGASWPIDEVFLDALAHMPPASGCALGFDRLLMLAAGATHINHVLWTPPL